MYGDQIASSDGLNSFNAGSRRLNGSRAFALRCLQAPKCRFKSGTLLVGGSSPLHQQVRLRRRCGFEPVARSCRTGGAALAPPSKIAITLHVRGACNLMRYFAILAVVGHLLTIVSPLQARAVTPFGEIAPGRFTRAVRRLHAPQRLQSSLPSPSSKAERLSCHLRRTIRLPGRLASRRLVSVARVDQGGLSSVSETSRMTRPRRSGRPKNGTRRPMSTDSGFTRPSRHRNYPAPRSRVILS